MEATALTTLKTGVGMLDFSKDLHYEWTPRKSVETLTDEEESGTIFIPSSHSTKGGRKNLSTYTYQPAPPLLIVEFSGAEERRG